MTRPAPALAIGALAVLSCCSPPSEGSADGETRAEAVVRSARSGVYSSEQAARGRAAYVQACSECHLRDLSGSDIAPPLRGSSFLQKRAGSTVGDLYALVRSTMPPDQAFSLTPEAYVDIAAYLLSENGLPFGDGELAASEPVLGLIVFDAESGAEP